MTDTAATRPYGVLGRVLGHSYTPTIYKELAGLEYVRFEREPEDLQAFMTGDEWEGTNVTIPYKRAVMEYLDELSPLAERMGNVNTITRLPDGRLRGDNTDYFGFRCLVEELGVEVAGKKVLVLGATGGAGTTASMVLGDLAHRRARGTRERGQLRQHRTAVRRHVARQLHACRYVPPLPRRALHARRTRCARGRHRHCLQPRPHGSDARGRAPRNPLHRRPAHACGPGGTGCRALYRPSHPARAHPGCDGASISPRAEHRADRHAGFGQDPCGRADRPAHGSRAH